jgi:hypothetical protein
MCLTGQEVKTGVRQALGKPAGGFDRHQGVVLAVDQGDRAGEREGVCVHFSTQISLFQPAQTGIQQGLGRKSRVFQ